jgi:hypothetical protein
MVKNPIIKSAVIVNELAFNSAQHPFLCRGVHDNMGSNTLAGRGGISESLLILEVLRITAVAPWIRGLGILFNARRIVYCVPCHHGLARREITAREGGLQSSWRTLLTY